jgi:hypothetical protein
MNQLHYDSHKEGPARTIEASIKNYERTKADDAHVPVILLCHLLVELHLKMKKEHQCLAADNTD